MSENALAQRRRNLRIWRERGHLWRSYSESQAIRWLIWQWTLDPEPKLSGRALARRLGVWERYVRKVRDKALNQGADRLPAHRTTWEELARARDLTGRGRYLRPDLFTPVPSSPPENKRPANGPAHVSPEEYERQRRTADTEVALERLRERLGKTVVVPFGIHRVRGLGACFGRLRCSSFFGACL